MSINSFFYIIQAYPTTQKGENILYPNHFIIDQIIPAANVPTDVEDCKYWSDEVKMIRLLYDVNTGSFKELDETTAFLSRRDDFDVTFFHYGYNKETSMVLYSVQKTCIPNVFSGTLFNNHRNELLKNQQKDQPSKIFCFLLSVTDRKNIYKSVQE